MKTLMIFISILLLHGNIAKAQITLDTILPDANMMYYFNTVQISSTETKYYVADTITNSFSLYNMDFTPFILNVFVPEPFIKHSSSGPATFRAVYITRSLFDCDSLNIEYAYEDASNAYQTFYIMRTDGTELFRLDSANGPYCFGDCLGGADWIKPIVNTSAGAKLFLQRGYPGYIVHVYSLCGSLPSEIMEFNNSDFHTSFVNVFPNPASNSVTFEIHPPSNMKEYELVIVDVNARELRREKVSVIPDKYIIDVNSFSNGTYFYTLCTKDKSYQSGKFVLNK